MNYKEDEIMEYIEEEDAKFIRLAFRDVFGVQKNIAVMPGEVEKAFEDGIPINARQIDDLTRDITSKVLKETGVYLTAIAVYSLNTKDPVITDMHDQIQKIVLSNKNVMQMHGFYVNLEKKAIRFDMVISFDEKDRKGLYERISQQVKDIYPDFQISIIMDTDFSEE